MPKRVLLLLAFAISAQAASPAGVMLGYITGNDYMALSIKERQIWVIGVADGIMAEGIESAKAAEGPWLGRCLRGIPGSQLVAILEKDLRDRPDSWHAPAALVFRGTMQKFCKGRSEP